MRAAVVEADPGDAVAVGRPPRRSRAPSATPRGSPRPPAARRAASRGSTWWSPGANSAPGRPGGDGRLEGAQLASGQQRARRRPSVAREGVQVAQGREVGAVPRHRDRAALLVAGRQAGRRGQLGGEGGVAGQRVQVEPQQRRLGVVQLGDRREHAGRGVPGPAVRVGVDERSPTARAGRSASAIAAPIMPAPTTTTSLLGGRRVRRIAAVHSLPRAGITRIRFDGRLAVALSARPAASSRASATLRSADAGRRDPPSHDARLYLCTDSRPRTGDLADVPRRRAGRRRRRRPAAREGARGARGDAAARDRSPRRPSGTARCGPSTTGPTSPVPSARRCCTSGQDDLPVPVARADRRRPTC